MKTENESLVSGASHSNDFTARQWTRNSWSACCCSLREEGRGDSRDPQDEKKAQPWCHNFWVMNWKHPEITHWCTPICRQTRSWNSRRRHVFSQESQKDCRDLGDPDLYILNVKHRTEIAEVADDLHAARKLSCSSCRGSWAVSQGWYTLAWALGWA